MSTFRSSTSPVKKGDSLVFVIVSTNTSLVPTAADSTPTVTAYASTDVVAKTNPLTSFTVTAVSAETGVYGVSRSTSDLTAGTVYHAIIAYAVSSANRRQIVDFLIA